MASDEALREIREHREELEAVAESDLPADWIAEALLEIEADARN